MTASESNPEKGQERTGVDLIHDASDELEVNGHMDHEAGDGRIVVEQGEPIDAAVRFHFDGLEPAETGVTVGANWFTDAPPQVRLKQFHPQLTLTGEMTPSRARELAAELRLAATHAEQGATEVGFYDD